MGVLEEYNKTNAELRARSQAVPQQQQMSYSDALGKVYKIAETDQRSAQAAYSVLKQMRSMPESPFYNPYSAPTNQAVSNLAALGFDTNNLNKGFIEQNRQWISSNLIYSGTTNTPSKPGKKATADQRLAYELYQWDKSEEQTAKAEQEYQDVLNEARYWTKRTDRNYSDDEIIGKVKENFDKKYPTLAKMQDSGFQPLELNRAVDYSDDTLYGAIWAERNGYDGNMDAAIGYNALGVGEQWKLDPKIAAKLDSNDPAFNPYSVGSTNVDDAALFFGVSKFDKDWLQKNDGMQWNGTDEQKAMYKKVQAAEENTLKAEAALDALDKWLGKMKKTKPEDAKKALDRLLSKGSVTINGTTVDLSILNKMDVSIGKDQKPGTGDLIAMTRGVDYKYDEFLQKVYDVCEKNANQESGLQIQNNPAGTSAPAQPAPATPAGPEQPAPAAPVMTESDIETDKAKTGKSTAAYDTVSDTLTENESAVWQNAPAVSYEQTVNFWNGLKKAGGQIVKDMATGLLHTSVGGYIDNSLQSTKDVTQFETVQANLAEYKKEFDEYKAKYGDIELLQKEFKPQMTATMGDYTVDLIYDDAKNAYTVGQIFINGTDLAEYAELDIELMNRVNAEAEQIARDESAKALKIKKAHEALDAAGEQGKEELEAYKNLDALIYEGEKYIADNQANYDKQKTNLSNTTGGLQMMRTAAEWLGLDTTGVDQAEAVLKDLYNYYEQPQLPRDGRTASQRIDEYAKIEGKELTAKEKSAGCKNAIKKIDDAIDRINMELEYLDNNKYQVPDGIRKNMQYRLEDLQAERKGYEYAMMMADADPEEKKKAIEAGKRFEQRLEDNPEDFLIDDTIHRAYGFKDNSVANEEEKETYYYLLGQQVLENEAEYDRLLKSNNPDDVLTGANEMLASILKDSSDYLDYMLNDDYGVWRTRIKEANQAEASEMVKNGNAVGANALSTLLTPVESIASALYLFDRAVTGRRINPDSKFRSITDFKEATREETTRSIDEYYKNDPFMRKVANIGYEIYCNRGDSLMNSIAFGWMAPGEGILSQTVGASPMGATAALTAAAHAIERGATMEQAWAIAGVTFIFETGTEGITYSNIKEALGVTGEMTKDSLKGYLLDWLKKSGPEEVFGESITDVAENWIDDAVTRFFDNPNFVSQHEELVRKYRAEGYEDDAEAMAYAEEAQGVMHTALVSYLSAGTDVFTKAGKAAINTFNRYRGLTRIDQRMGGSNSILDNMVKDWKNGKNAPVQETETQTDQGTEATAEQTETQTEQAETTQSSGETKQETTDNHQKLETKEERMDDAAPVKKTESTPEQQEAAKDIANIERSKGGDQSAQTAAVSSALNTGENTDAANDRANAAATYLGGVVRGNVSTTMQEVIRGAAEAGVDGATVKKAMQNAALGNGAATALVQSDAFQQMTPQEKAKALADTVPLDDTNVQVQQTIESKVKDYRATRVMADMAANGHFDQAEAAREAAEKAAENTATAKTMLEEKQGETDAAVQNLQTIDQQFQENPSEENGKQRADAVTRVNNADVAEHQMEQHLANEEAAQRDAEEKARKAKEDATNAARETANATIAQTDQQRAEQAAAQAEQERQAQEEEARLQLEEDERTGKAQEDRENAAIDIQVDSENLDQEESEQLKEDLKEQKEKVKLRLRDLSKKMTDAEGILAIRAMERKLGIKIQLDDLGPIAKEGWTRGKYANGVVHLNQNMTIGQALVEACLHEITHSMEGTAAYKSYRSIIMDSLFGMKNMESMDMYNDSKNTKYRQAIDDMIQDRTKANDPNFVGKSLSEQIDAAEKEIIADFARLNLAEKDVVQRFMDNGLGGKVRNTLHNINQALKNYLSNMTGEERKTAEYLRRAERAFQKAMNDVAKASTHPEGGQFSIMQIAQATGMTFNENTLQLFDKDGNEIDGVNNKITPDMINETPVGLLIDNGLTGDQNTAAKEMMAGLMNMVARYKDSDLVWEIGATTLSSTFSALKSNSDPQYKTTVDFGTVCAKTQAIIDTLSQVMLDRVKEGKYGGLDRKDIMKVYDAVNQAGLSVPCPVCYVFSRWMGVPSLLGQMSQYQHDYVVTDKNGKIDKKATQEKVDAYIEKAQAEYGDAKAINNQKTKLQNKRASLEENRIELEAKKHSKDLTDDQKADIENQLNAVLDEQVSVDNKIGEVSAYNWITQALCKKDKNGKFVVDDKFKLTPDEILFDLNRTGDFAGYEKNWRYRNTRGAGMGKAIMPYSGETIGDILYGVKKGGRMSSLRNPWLNMDDKAAKRQLKDARNRARKQNLVGGQRLQSTSDFRPEWGLDYIMSFLELQAAGSKVQMYTKVSEAVDFFASVGADVNMSIMGKGTGWRLATADEIAQMTPEQKEAATIDDKVYMLEFSDITGMKYDTAKGLKDKYNNVQMILVGMNDTHIRLAMKNSDIDFIIPWHSSGNSKDVLAGLIKSVGEKLDSSVDYTTTQTDMVKGTVKKYTDENGNKVEYTVPGEQTEDEKKLWDARMKLLTKGNKELTSAERATLLSNPFTADLYKRFTQEGVDPDCYSVKLSKEQASQIFPYEYWQTDATKPGGTKETADENGRRFVEYCEAMGIVPRFSQFKDDPGYWKLLIDRPMYNKDGSYHKQSTIDVTQARIGDLNESGQLENSDLPKQAQAKYAPKDPRNENYEKYTEAQRRAVENAEAAIDQQYDDGTEGQYSVYGEMTEADQEMLSQAAEDYKSAMSRGDTEAAAQDVEDYASSKGYTDEAFHGSDFFGFTEFDMKKSQDQIFVSYNKDVASTYSSSDDVKNISDKYIATMSNERLADFALKVSQELEEGTESITYNSETGMFEATRGVWNEDGTDFSTETIELSKDDIKEMLYEYVADSERLSGVYKSKAVREALTSGIYRFYTRPGKQLIVDAGGADWNAVPVPWQDTPMKTRDIGEYARAHGYDSVRINDVHDYGSSRTIDKNQPGQDIGIFFNQDDVKSADTATYDDSGRLLQLNERFTDKTDFRYSTSGEMTEADQEMLREQEMNETLVKAGALTQEEVDAYNEKTSRPMEGKRSPKWSLEEGPAQRQFGGEEGMLQVSEIEQEAIDYVQKHNAYFPDTNAGQIMRAINWIRKNGSKKNDDGTYTQETDGFAESLQKVTSKSFDYRSADGQARMIATMAMAVAKNDVAAQVALAESFNRQGTDLGRALQSRKIFRMMTPSGRIASIQKMMTDMQDELAAKGKKIDLKFSDWIYRAASAATDESDFAQVQQAAATELANQLPIAWKDRLQSFRMLSMLANPRTHIRNVIGNAMFVPAVGLKNKMSALMELGMKKGDRTKTLAPILSKEARDFARQDAITMKDELTGEAKYNEQSNVKSAQKPLGKIGGFLSDLNSNALEAEDWLFLKGHYRRALGGWMMANGYTAEQLQNDPALLEKGRTYAIQEAQKATYRDFNKTAQTLNQISRNGGVTGFLVDATLPFKKTPANILKRGIEYSPVGIVKSLTNDMYRMKQYLDYQNGKLDVLPEKAMSPNQVIDHLCSGLSGTGIMALGWLLSGAGAVSSGLDDDEDKFEKAKGNQEYAINPGKALNALFNAKLFGEDVTYTIDWAAPMSMPFFVGAAIREQMENEGSANVEDFLNAVGGITEPVFNLSMLDGVNTLFKTSSYDNGENPITQIISKIGTNYASSFVPSALGAATRTFFDDTRRKSFVPQGQGSGSIGNARYALENAQNKIPGLSKQNIPARDIWGNAEISPFIERLFENFISPGYINEYKEDPIINEMARLYDATGDKSMIPEIDPSKSYTYTKNGVKNKVVFTDKEWDQYKETRGKTAFKELTELINSQDYQNADNATQIKMIDGVWDHANKVGLKAVIPDLDVKETSIGTIAADSRVTVNKNKLIDSLKSGDYEGYEDLIEALHNDGVEDSEIKNKIATTYRDQYKSAYLDGNYEEMAEIEDILDNTGFDFDYDKWQNDAEEKRNSGSIGMIASNGIPRITFDQYDPIVDRYGSTGLGNIDLNSRQVVQNDDGSISTERSMSFYDEDTGKEVLIPTVIDGRIVSEDEAIDHYYETGEYLGMFDTPEEADNYADLLHRRQDWYYNR